MRQKEMQLCKWRLEQKAPSLIPDFAVWHRLVECNVSLRSQQNGLHFVWLMIGFLGLKWNLDSNDFCTARLVVPYIKDRRMSSPYSGPNKPGEVKFWLVNYFPSGLTLNLSKRERSLRKKERSLNVFFRFLTSHQFKCLFSF